MALVLWQIEKKSFWCQWHVSRVPPWHCAFLEILLLTMFEFSMEIVADNRD